MHKMDRTTGEAWSVILRASPGTTRCSVSRSEEKAVVLAGKGVDVLRGTLDDLDRLAEAPATPKR